MPWNPFLDNEITSSTGNDVDDQGNPSAGVLRPLQDQALQGRRGVGVLHVAVTMPALFVGFRDRCGARFGAG